jgi:hypothetical protein
MNKLVRKLNAWAVESEKGEVLAISNFKHTDKKITKLAKELGMLDFTVTSLHHNYCGIRYNGEVYGTSYISAVNEEVAWEYGRLLNRQYGYDVTEKAEVVKVVQERSNP